MVAVDCAFPISFEMSANSVVIFVVIAGILLINKRNSRGTKIVQVHSRALQIVQVPMWIIHLLQGLPLFYLQ